MRRRFAAMLQQILPLIGQLRSGFEWLFVVVLRAWRWANALDIPLSQLQWVLLFYAVFSVAYLFATPVFEANDEIWHFGVIRHLRQSASLPEQVFDGKDTLYQQHGSQPPLYYALMTILTLPIDIADADDMGRLNPHVKAGEPDSFGNKNLIIHASSAAPFGGAGLAVYVLRLAGLGLGAGTIGFVFKIGQLIAPQRPTVAFVAAAITGLNPMFIFVSASVNNDSLAMAINGALIWLLLRSLRDGFSLRVSMAIALLFALTCLTKLTSLVLLPLLLGVPLLAYRKTGNRPGLATFFILLVLSWLLISGWWYARNIHLYGDALGLATMANIAGPRGMNVSLADVLAGFQQFRMSYWGLFGALNIQLAGIFYVALDLMTFLSVIGLIFLVLQLLAISDFAYARYELTHLATMIGAFVLLWLGVIFWSTQVEVVEGRILFPLIAVVSPLMAVGLVEIVWWIVFSLRPPNLEFVRAGDAVPKELLNDTMLWQLRLLGIVALVAPFTVIAGQYQAPQPLAEIPPSAREVYADYGDVALVAYEHVDRRYTTGDRVRLTLYWRVLQQSAEDNSIALTLVDDNGHAIGNYVTYPGAGSLRTSDWLSGAVYPDMYLIDINQAAYGRYPFDLRVEWTDGSSADGIAATDAEGRLIEPVLLDVGAVVTVRYQTAITGFNEITADAQPVFDEAIRLEGFQLDLELNEIVLNWKTEAVPEENYTVFVHVLDENNEIVTQADDSPRLPTKYWRWGESYSTFHRLAPEFDMLDYRVTVGLYVNDGLTYPRAEYRLISVDEETQEETEQIFDAYTLDWDSASEVLALTPTPVPTSEGDDGAALETEFAATPGPFKSAQGITNH